MEKRTLMTYHSICMRPKVGTPRDPEVVCVVTGVLFDFPIKVFVPGCPILGLLFIDISIQENGGPLYLAGGDHR